MFFFFLICDNEKLYDSTPFDQIETAKKLFSELWDKRTPLRLIGISLTQITAEDNTQLSFFPTENREKERKLDKAMDAIRSRFGSETVVRASNYNSELNVGKKYKAQMENNKK